MLNKNTTIKTKVTSTSTAASVDAANVWHKVIIFIFT